MKDYSKEAGKALRYYQDYSCGVQAVGSIFFNIFNSYDLQSSLAHGDTGC
jgi:hypothetical protein